MPTETDVGLADDLAEFRLDTEKRFGTLQKDLAGIERELKFIRWIGIFFTGVLTTLVGTSIGIAWSASGVVSEVRYQGQRLDEFKGRLDGVGTDVRQLQKNTAELRSDVRQLEKDTAEIRKDMAEFRAESKARDDRLAGALERITEKLDRERPTPK